MFGTFGQQINQTIKNGILFALMLNWTMDIFFTQQEVNLLMTVPTW